MELLLVLINLLVLMAALAAIREQRNVQRPPAPRHVIDELRTARWQARQAMDQASRDYLKRVNQQMRR